MENFRRLFADETYIDSFKTTAIFSVLVAGFGILIALVLAVFADRVLRGAAVYKTLLVWPYAVAPAVAGVLWLFMFAPSIGIVPYALRLIGYEWNHLLNADHAMALIVMAAVWKQISYNFLFFLAGLQGIPKSLIEAAAIDGAGPWRRFWTIVFRCVTRTFSCWWSTSFCVFERSLIDASPQGELAKKRRLGYKVYYYGFNGWIGSSAAQSVCDATSSH